MLCPAFHPQSVISHLNVLDLLIFLWYNNCLILLGKRTKRTKNLSDPYALMLCKFFHYMAT